MPRYIDADALQVDCMRRYCGDCDCRNGLKCRACWVDDMLEEIGNAPTVSPDEVRGKGEWIKAHDDTAWWWECSVCHEPPLQRYKCDRLSNFCPNCGAKMEVSEDARKHN